MLGTARPSFVSADRCHAGPRAAILVVIARLARADDRFATRGGQMSPGAPAPDREFDYCRAAAQAARSAAA
jgi:hypothetical protein